MLSRWRTEYIAAAGGAVAAGLLFVVAHAVLPDDAYITLNYARNLAEAGHWGMLADRSSNTATSPLNVWLLAAGTLISGRPVLAVGLVLVACLSLVGWWSARLARELELSPLLPVALVGLLATSPLLVSTIGLETYLGVTVLVGVARYAVAGRQLATGVLCGLAVLTRPDLAVPAGVLVLGLVAWRRWALVAAVGAAVVLPWHVFAWYRLGGFLPDTVWFKTGDQWDGYTFTDGWVRYALLAPAPTVLALLPAVIGLLTVGWWLLSGYRHPARRLALVFATAGAAHWAAFAALKTAPYPWYLAPSAVCLMVTAAVTAAALRWRRAAAEMVGAVLVGCAVFLGSWHWQWGPLNANWGTAQQYAAIGHGVAAITRHDEVLVHYEVGTPAFFCPCRMVEWFGDRALADRLIADRVTNTGPILGALMRWNFAHRAPTPPPHPRWLLQPGKPAAAVASWPIGGIMDRPLTWVSLIPLSRTTE